MNSKKFYDSAGNYHVSLHSVTTLTADREVKLLDSSATLVGDTSTQTLTNKTLTSPTLTTPTITDLTLGNKTTPLVTTGVGTVTIVETTDGIWNTTTLTLTNFIVGALASAAAALGLGNIVCAYPAGVHLEGPSYFSLSLTAAGTAVAGAVTGLGSVIATGAVADLTGTTTFQDRLVGTTTATASGGGAVAVALLGTTAGAFVGIALNKSGSIKNVFVNSAATWNANNSGNLTATGTIKLRWSVV